MSLLNRFKEAKNRVEEKLQRAGIEGLAFIAGVKAATGSFADQQVEIRATAAGVSATTKAFTEEIASDFVAAKALGALARPEIARDSFVGEIVHASAQKIVERLPNDNVAMAGAQELVREGVREVITRVAEGKTQVPSLVQEIVVNPAIREVGAQLETETGRKMAEIAVLFAATKMAQHPEAVMAVAQVAVTRINQRDTRSFREKLVALFKKDPQDAPIVNWFKDVAATVVEKGTLLVSKVYAAGKSLENGWNNFNRNAQEFMDSASAALSGVLGIRKLQAKRVGI
jgi:hypothetical protein